MEEYITNSEEKEIEMSTQVDVEDFIFAVPEFWIDTDY